MRIPNEYACLLELGALAEMHSLQLRLYVHLTPNGPVFEHPDYNAPIGPTTIALVHYRKHFDLVLLQPSPATSETTPQVYQSPLKKSNRFAQISSRIIELRKVEGRRIARARPNIKQQAKQLSHRKQDTLRHRSVRSNLLIHEPETAYANREQNRLEHQLRRASQREATQLSTPSVQLAATAIPTSDILKQFEQSAIAAQLLFAKGSGFNAHNDIFPGASIDFMTNLEPISKEALMSSMKSFMNATNPGQCLNACASCGISELQAESGMLYNQFNLLDPAIVCATRELRVRDVFRIHSDQLSHYISGPYCEIRSRTIVDGEYYYLHQDLVQDLPATIDMGRRVLFSLCQDCNRAVNQGLLTSANVRYCDFGNMKAFQRIVLGKEGRQLSLAETVVSARSVVFNTVIKYAGSTKAKVHTGHCITFGHEGPVAVDNVLPRTSQERIGQKISAAFVAAKSDVLKLKESHATRSRFFNAHPELRMNADRVYEFLRFKKAMDPSYSKVQLQPFTEDVVYALESIPDAIIANMIACDDPKELEVEQAVHDNIAAVNIDERDFHTVTGPTQLLQNEVSTDADDTFHDAETESSVEGLEHVFITAKPTHQTLSVSDMLQSVYSRCFGVQNASASSTNHQEALNYEDNQQPTSVSTNTGASFTPLTSTMSHPTTPFAHVQIPVDAVPICEYVENRELLLSAYPDLFLLGQGLNADLKSKLSHRELRHLLFQYDRRFSRHTQFLFLLFDQLQRHTLASKISMKVKGGNQYVAQFGEMVNSPGFEQQVLDGIANPNSQQAKKIARVLNQVTSISNRNVPWTEEQRSFARAKLMAINTYTGPFSFFITANVNDIDNVLAMRIYDASKHKLSDVLDKSRFNTNNAEINLNFTLPNSKARFSNVTLDPVAQARVYKLFIEKFLTELVGKTPTYLKRRDDIDDGKGVFGEVYAYGFVTEELARGSTHTHGAIATDMSPMALSKHLNDPAVLAKMYKRLESIMQEHIPDHSEASRLAKVVSTFAAGCDDKMTRAHRDQRYLPTESHSVENIEASDSKLASIRVANSKNIVTESTGVFSITDSGVALPSGSCSDSCSSAESRIYSSSSSSSSEISELENETTCSIDEDGEPVHEVTLHDNVDFDNIMRRAYAIASSYNIHRHSFTCRKGKTGVYKCRMAYPRATNNRATGMVELCEDPVTGAPKAKTKFSVKVSTGDALRDVLDDRVIVLSMFRPSDDHDAKKQCDYDTATEDQPYWIEYQPGLNSAVVSFSPALTAMFSANTNVEFLGNFAQSKSATYYIIKYMTKDGNKVQTLLPVLLAAHRKVMAYPSKAADVFSADRNVQHLLNVLINGLNSKMEIGSETVALALLGMPSNIFSHDFEFLFVRPAVSFWRKIISDNLGNVDCEQSDAESVSDVDTSTNLAAKDSQSIVVHNTEMTNDTNFIDNNDNEDVIIDLYDNEISLAPDADDAGVRDIVVLPGLESSGIVTVAQHENYYFRCADANSELRSLTLYEWLASVRVFPKSSNKTKIPDNDDDNRIEETVLHLNDNTIRPGRKSNRTFDFHLHHALAKTHSMRLRSKQIIPILAGKPPPRHPGNITKDRKSQQAADDFAAYYLTLHRPWSSWDTPEQMQPLNYSELLSYVEQLELSANYMDKARLHWIQVGTHGFSVKARAHKLLSSYRARRAKYWNSNEKLDDDEPDTSNAANSNGGIAAEALRELEAMYSAFPEGESDEIKELHRNLESSTRLLEALDEPQALENFIERASARYAIPDTQINKLQEIHKSIREFCPEEFDAQGMSVMDAALGVSVSSNDNVCADSLTSMEVILNPDQQRAFDAVMTWYHADLEHRLNPMHAAAPSQLLMLVTGAAGTGKSCFIKQLVSSIEGPRIIFCTAPTGAAAVQLPDGYTVHSLFSIPVPKRRRRASKRKDHEDITDSSGTSQRRKAKFTLGDDVRIVVIDEFSMLSETIFQKIDSRLRDWCGNKTLPFGGVCVILMGDPYQLPPVCGRSLIASSCLLGNSVGELFSRFERFPFNIQQRSIEDSGHSSRLEYFRKARKGARPVAESRILDHLAELNTIDVQNDVLWRDATIVVAGNEQRVHLNMERAVAFAKRTNQPIIAWRQPLDEQSLRKVTTIATKQGRTVTDLLQNLDELTFYFVKGAPVVITDNISANLKIANGTSGILDSLVLCPSIADSEWEKIATLEAGEIHWLLAGQLPLAVMVEFPHLNLETWIPSLSLAPDKVLIPLVLAAEHQSKEAKTTQLRQSQCGVLTYFVDLAFVVTFYKVQGATVNRIILDLNTAGGNQKQVDLGSLYVGISRVRHSDHIRVLPISQKTRSRLLDFRFSENLIKWESKNDGEDIQ